MIVLLLLVAGLLVVVTTSNDSHAATVAKATTPAPKCVKIEKKSDPPHLLSYLCTFVNPEWVHIRVSEVDNDYRLSVGPSCIRAKVVITNGGVGLGPAIAPGWFISAGKIRLLDFNSASKRKKEVQVYNQFKAGGKCTVGVDLWPDDPKKGGASLLVSWLDDSGRDFVVGRAK